MEEVDIAIMGAGVVGLAVAERLSSTYDSLVVIEKNRSFGQETSSRNSEVIHSGIYYAIGSLKARMCVRGRSLLYDFCESNKVPYKKTGKLIVATEKEEVSSIERLFENGKENGVPGLSILSWDQMKKMEPSVSGVAALHSPETGILDSHIFMQRLFEKAKGSGASIVFDSEVMAVEKSNGGYKITVKDRSGNNSIVAKILINCAGLDSDIMAEMAGVDIKANKYDLHYCKGQYFRVNQKKAHLVNKLIYPVPESGAGGLGVHVTIDLGGGLRLGPDHKYLDDRIKDYSLDHSKAAAFYRSAKKFLPFLEEDDIAPDMAGIRPKLQSANEEFRDFVIAEETDKGFPGLIDLIGIESPGLTASLAIAEEVGGMVKGKI